MNRPAYLPNLLSSVRIVLAPALLGAAYSNSKTGFVLLLAIALASDVVDGLLARAWQAVSPLGCRLDRWGDGLTMVLGAVGVFFLWPGAVEREWQASLAVLAGYAAIGLQRWMVPSTKMILTRWWCRLASWAVPVALIPWLALNDPWPFRAAAALHLLMGVGRLVGAWSLRPSAKAAGAPESRALPAAQRVAG